MTEAWAVERAIAIRMTCGNPDVVGQAGAPVLVSYAEAGVGDVPADALRVGAEDSVEAMVGQLADLIGTSGSVPSMVVVEGRGQFTVTPARPDATHGRMRGCVAVVTGSAQGFGKGIAEELVREGACVVIADLNETLGRQLAADIAQAHGAGSAIFGRMDVTQLASIEACLATTVLTFGGVDMLVANAGVLRAGGLDALDEAGFDLVTNVNYKAYFLCAKAVAPLMKLQNRFDPHRFMDIVQINSKSGLEGSNKNFAYAGSKFGAIGLTQSFALELVGFNIKVNAVCPGNYFDGPLWSDPEKGLFVQYLKAGKVPGAETVEDVKKFYMAKAPMNRGCTPLDVARAIFYLHDQEYEIGQALPVTGGQVMLN